MNSPGAGKARVIVVDADVQIANLEVGHVVFAGQPGWEGVGALVSLGFKADRPSAFTFYNANNDPSGGYDLKDLSKGTLSRVEKSDVPYSIIVNGEKKDLPTLHVKGVLGSHTFELWVLDDVNNPLVQKSEGCDFQNSTQARGFAALCLKARLR